MNSYFRWDGNSLLLSCYLQPGASKTGFAGLYDQHLKIRVSAPPVDGKANQLLIKFIAKSFGVKRQQVALVSGATHRRKKLRIDQPQKIPSQLAISRESTG